MEKETKTTTEKNAWEKAREPLCTALMAAGVVFIVLLLIWIPFKLVPAIFGNGTQYVSTTLSSLLVPGESAEVTKVNQNDASNVSSSNQTANTSAGSASNNKGAQVQYVNYYGKPDMQITLVDTGIIDPASKQFIQTNYAGFNDEIAIRFEVKNVGTNVSGPWKLRINAPSRTTPYYDSDYQQSIKPGDRMVFTTSFNSPTATGINTVYITVDPLNLVDESNETNNSLTVPIRIDGTYYTYSNNYNYGNSNIAVPNVPYGSLYTWTNISVDCYAAPQTSYVGSPVTWYATVSGGNGYFTYLWAGSDLLTSNQSAVTKTYYSSGTKVASITVTSNGQSVTKQCTANIY